LEILLHFLSVGPTVCIGTPLRGLITAGRYPTPYFVTSLMAALGR